MIAESSLFRKIVTTYMKEEVRDQIIAEIKKYERTIRERVALQDIIPMEYNKCLNSSIDMIEKTVYIQSWMNQLYHIIREKKDLKSKEYIIEKVRISKQIDQLETLSEMTNKTEKTKLKQFMMEEQMIELEAQMDELKTDLSIADIYVKDAEGLKGLVYSYYQAIKNMETIRG